MRQILLLIIIITSILVLVSCGSKTNTGARNIEQIQQEEGIPVKVTEISYQPFSLSLSFNTGLSGIRETTITSLLGDRVESVLVKVGDYVEKDQLLLAFPEDNPVAQYRQAKAAYESAEQTYQRMSALYEDGGISRQELDQLETMRKINLANYQAAGKMVYVKAPISGYVTSINLRETESAGPGDPLLTISQIDRYRAKVWVIERDINTIQPGQRVIARWQDIELPGRVIQVARSIDSDRQAFGVDLEFSNLHGLLLSGMMITVEIFFYENETAIIVPRQYIHSDDQGTFVYLNVNDKADKRYVELGRNDLMLFEIASGLVVGDKMVYEGSHLIRTGARIRIDN